MILTTQRLILRPFEERDLEALLEIYGDREANRFLPCFPMQTREQARAALEGYERDRARGGAAYALCGRDDRPIGALHMSPEESHDFGYVLRREYWRQGIVTEAARAVIGELARQGVPYITATHDRNNPRSGAVMQKIGMTYRYSYLEQWQPKNFPVIFRMYQLNLDGRDRLYRQYWEEMPVHFIEKL